MIKGLLGVIVAAALFAGAVYLILHFLGILIIIAGFLVVFGILALLIIFLVFFAIGVVLFFAVFYYIIEKKPSITPGEYHLDMEKGKHEK